MPRLPRVEFEGAVYHVMARGNHGSNIVFSDEDRRVFMTTLDEVCEKTGWHCYAWVLMSNHYHIAFRTPEANLVAGMTWFQQTFTQRINARNRLRGHLFAGRYKAILVENEDLTGSRYRSDYLANLIQYVHLNPARAGLVDGGEKRTLDYQWSSATQWYAVAPSKRPAHAQVSEGLGILQFKDTVGGRRGYIAELDETTRQEAYTEAGYFLPEEQSLQSTIKRGWYWGSEHFRDVLLEKFAKQIGTTLSGPSEGTKRITQDHGEARAKSILSLAMKQMDMTDAELLTNQYGDQRRNAIAYALATHTTLRHKRIAELLKLSSTANASQRINRFSKMGKRKLSKPIREFLKMSGNYT